MLSGKGNAFTIKYVPVLSYFLVIATKDALKKFISKMIGNASYIPVVFILLPSIRYFFPDTVAAIFILFSHTIYI